MQKNNGKTCMVGEPSHVKQISLNHVCKIGLKLKCIKFLVLHFITSFVYIKKDFSAFR
jgi:hypothetical protein